jgi:hypothetical protein
MLIAAIAGVLNVIRTRALTMAIDIKNDSEQSGVDLAHIKPGSPEAVKVQQTIVHQRLRECLRCCRRFS